MIGRTILDGFKIIRPVGEGGMGAVYLAEHETLGNRLAIKVLHATELHREEIVKRFLAEAKAIAELGREWPGESNIVRVTTAGGFDDGRLYIALEYLEGETLGTVLKRDAPIDLELALALIAQACCGLEAVHHAGIVHRDLKPANLFLCPRETMAWPHLKILDFGIAKLGDSAVDASEINTKAGLVMGTYQYMAPEQTTLSGSPVQARTDLYSLGVIAYGLVTGRAPYRSPKKKEAAIFLRQLGATGMNPVDPRSFRADLPEGWAGTIMSMMSHDPADRPSSALAVAHRLARATPNGLAVIERTTPLLLSKRWLERTRKMKGIDVRKLLGPAGRMVRATPTAATVSSKPSGSVDIGTTDLEAEKTTLSSAAQSLPRQTRVLSSPQSSRRTKTWLTAGAIASVIVVVGLVASQRNANTEASDVSTVDAGVKARASSVGVTTDDAQRAVDAGAQEKRGAVVPIDASVMAVADVPVTSVATKRERPTRIRKSARSFPKKTAAKKTSTVEPTTAKDEARVDKPKKQPTETRVAKPKKQPTETPVDKPKKTSTWRPGQPVGAN